MDCKKILDCVSCVMSQGCSWWINMTQASGCTNDIDTIPNLEYIVNGGDKDDCPVPPSAPTPAEHGQVTALIGATATLSIALVLVVTTGIYIFMKRRSGDGIIEPTVRAIRRRVRGAQNDMELQPIDSPGIEDSIL